MLVVCCGSLLLDFLVVCSHSRVVYPSFTFFGLRYQYNCKLDGFSLKEDVFWSTTLILYNVE